MMARMADNEPNQPELTPELQAKLNNYQRAIEEEFAQAEAKATKTGEDFETLIRETFKDHTPEACAQVVWLASNADSEGIRLQASKLIISEAFKIAEKEADPITKLIRDLQANDDADEPVSESEDALPNGTDERAKRTD